MKMKSRFMQALLRSSASAGWAYMVAAALVPSAASASPDTCLAKVQRFAAAHDLSINPPNIGGSAPNGTPSKELGKSGGVIEPPRTNDPAVIRPNVDHDYRMPTMPDIRPETHKDQGTPPAAVHPSDRALLESVLVAAREEARRGHEEGCLLRLEKAQQLAERQGR